MARRGKRDAFRAARPIIGDLRSGGRGWWIGSERLVRIDHVHRQSRNEQ